MHAKEQAMAQGFKTNNAKSIGPAPYFDGIAWLGLARLGETWLAFGSLECFDLLPYDNDL